MTNNKQQTAVDFIPYELALELKQLGFDEPCFGYYDVTQQLHLCGFENMSNKGFISAPTYSQAFRWFREENGHNGVIEGCKKHGFEWCIYPDMEHYIKPPNNFNTYEEAELACLRKLIEITCGGGEQ